MAAVGPHISRVSPWPGPPLSGLLKPCDRPVILTGAGVSAGCGLPTGGELATWLRAQPFASGVDFSVLDGRERGEHPGYVASAILAHDHALRGTLAPRVAAHIAECQTTATFSKVITA